MDGWNPQHLSKPPMWGAGSGNESGDVTIGIGTVKGAAKNFCTLTSIHFVSSESSKTGEAEAQWEDTIWRQTQQGCQRLLDKLSFINIFDPYYLTTKSLDITNFLVYGLSV